MFDIQTIPSKKEIVQRIGDSLVASGWEGVLHNYLTSQEFGNVIEGLLGVKRQGLFFSPTIRDMFQWLKRCPIEKVKVVIFIDASHKKVRDTGIPLDKPSKWMMQILDSVSPKASSTEWIKKGALMLPLSPTRTVGGNPHYEIWKGFISYFLSKLGENHEDIPYVLIGKNTQQFIPLIRSNHIKLATLWPEFNMGNWHEWTNDVLEMQGRRPIKWN